LQESLTLSAGYTRHPVNIRPELSFTNKVVCMLVETDQQAPAIRLNHEIHVACESVRDSLCTDAFHMHLLPSNSSDPANANPCTLYIA